MADLYSFVDAVDGLESKIKLLEDVIIRISVQTTECGIFIKQYVSHGFTGRLLDSSSVLCSALNNQIAQVDLHAKRSRILPKPSLTSRRH